MVSGEFKIPPCEDGRIVFSFDNTFSSYAEKSAMLTCWSKPCHPLMLRMDHDEERLEHLPDVCLCLSSRS